MQDAASIAVAMHTVGWASSGLACLPLQLVEMENHTSATMSCA